MLRLLAVLVAIAGVSLAHRLPRPEVEPHWQAFKGVFQKAYLSRSEELKRRLIFEDNFDFIVDFNAGYSNQAGLVLGVNQFADMTNDEYRAAFLGLRYSPSGTSKANRVFVATNGSRHLPDEVDWRTKGYVTPVKNQGDCGSCWAFSATGSLEGQHFRKTGQLVSLSEQNLVDCSTAQHNDGCNGGLMDQAFTYVKVNGGIDTEASYPYLGVDSTCAFRNGTIGATVTGYVDVKSGDEAALREAVAAVGPVSVAIDASSIFFQFYRSGVFDPWFCSSTNLDHGVLVVGYGHENDKDFWLVKNSWGSGWGESGYIKMVRNKNNRCGIATSASYPLV